MEDADDGLEDPEGPEDASGGASLIGMWLGGSGKRERISAILMENEFPPRPDMADSPEATVVEVGLGTSVLFLYTIFGEDWPSHCARQEATLSSGEYSRRGASSL